MKDAKILVGHCVQVLDGLPANSIHACITSPPYYRLRQYDAVADWPEITYAPLPGLPEIAIPAMCCELGLEQDLAHYVGHLVHVFRSVRRVLRPEGTLWLNLGDGWASTGKRGASRDDFNARWNGSAEGGKAGEAFHYLPAMNVPTGLQRKDLCGVPWRVAFALQADGWLLRSEVIWAKKNCMPDPTEDRPTRSHETVFQLAKRLDYFHDGFAIREDHTMKPQRRPNGHKRRRPGVLLPEHTFSGTARDDPGVDGHPAGRNARSVWEISTTPFKEAHFAVMPVELAQRCVLACTSERGVCPACGAPHVRVVERAKLEDAAREHSKFGDGHVMAENRRRHVSLAGDAYQEQRDDRPPFTVRWDAGCACAAGDPVPATVLDPFSGAATTAVAALRAGRSFVGVECNEAYADMSRKRLTRDAGQDLMFTREGLLPPRS